MNKANGATFPDATAKKIKVDTDNGFLVLTAQFIFIIRSPVKQDRNYAANQDGGCILLLPQKEKVPSLFTEKTNKTCETKGFKSFTDDDDDHNHLKMIIIKHANLVSTLVFNRRNDMQVKLELISQVMSLREESDMHFFMISQVNLPFK